MKAKIGRALFARQRFPILHGTATPGPKSGHGVFNSNLKFLKPFKRFPSRSVRCEAEARFVRWKRHIRRHSFGDTTLQQCPEEPCGQQIRSRAKRKRLERFQGISPESQGQNPALTVMYRVRSTADPRGYVEYASDCLSRDGEYRGTSRIRKTKPPRTLQ